jgi:anti-sigma B factor antagonist
VSLQVETTERYARVALEGEVDRANAEELERLVLRRTIGSAAVVLDLSAVSYLDSAGVRLLDRVARGLVRRGAALRIVAPPGGPVRYVLRIVAFGDDLVCDDLGSAVAALS